MAYEVTQIESTSAVPNKNFAEMREERVVEPYRQIIPREIKISGQSAINSTTANPDSTLDLPEATVTLSPQMAALARKEQKFRLRELDLKKQADSLAQDKAEIAELKALKAKLAAKDYSGIENLVKYDDYTNYLIEKEGNLSPQEIAVKKLADEVEGLKTAQKDDVTKRFDAAVNERRKAVKQLVETNPEFSRIKKAKAEEAVVQHILDTWEHDNEDLSPEQALKEVNDELIRRANEWKSLLDEEAKEEPLLEGQVKQLPPLKPAVKTITNNMAVTGEIKRPAKSFSNMSDTERWAEARRRAEDKLKLQTRG